jgi:hypothetical protein
MIKSETFTGCTEPRYLLGGNDAISGNLSAIPEAIAGAANATNRPHISS